MRRGSGDKMKTGTKTKPKIKHLDELAKILAEAVEFARADGLISKKEYTKLMKALRETK